MAILWYWREGETTNGPVSFRELVVMVRDHVLDADDLVRPDYPPKWQSAESVPGLFVMAGRADAITKWEEERRQEAENAAERADCGNESISLGDIEEMLNFAESLPSLDSEEPAWQRRLKEVDAQRSLEDGERREKLAAERMQQLKDGAIAAAITNMELKETTQRKRWRWSSWTVTGSKEMLGYGVQWVLSFAAANLTAIGILAWSETESLRYPDRQAGVVQTRSFPMWGQCSGGEYMFLLVDTMLISGIVGYTGGKLLVSMTDE